jgi:hypothetical protein
MIDTTLVGQTPCNDGRLGRIPKRYNSLDRELMNWADTLLWIELLAG